MMTTGHIGIGWHTRIAWPSPGGVNGTQQTHRVSINCHSHSPLDFLTWPQYTELKQ